MEKNRKYNINKTSYKRKRGKDTSLTGIGLIIDKTFKKLGYDYKIKQNKLFEVWDEVVGKQISSIAQPYEIKFKTLFVNVRDSTWKRQLIFLETTIIDKIAKKLGKKIVDEIQFRIGDVVQIIDDKNKESLNNAIWERKNELALPTQEDITNSRDLKLKKVLQVIRAKGLARNAKKYASKI